MEALMFKDKGQIKKKSIACEKLHYRGSALTGRSLTRADCYGWDVKPVCEQSTRSNKTTDKSVENLPY